MDSQPKLKWTHDSWNTSIIRNTESCMNVKYFRGFIDNDIWSHPCPQEKQLHQLVVVTSPPLWSTSPPPLSLITPEYPHNYSCLFLCHLLKTKMMIVKVKYNHYLTKEKNSVVKIHHANSMHWPGQSTTRDLPPLSSRGAIHFSRGKGLIVCDPASGDQKTLHKWF